MLRYLVAFCSVVLGILIAAWDVMVSLPDLPPRPPGIPGRESPEEQRLIFNACVTFYGVAYATGRLLYRWLGAPGEAEVLRKWSRWHMALLNLIGGGWLVLS